MLKGKKYFALLVVLSFTVKWASGQGTNSESRYLFHWHPFKQVQPNIPNNKRGPKTRFDFGLVFAFYKNDPHYTNSTEPSGGYTIGVKEEIPVFHYSSLLFGFDFYKEGISFNSYYFAKGYSFLYIPSEEVYNHNISIDEVHFPVEYKFSFGPETKSIRTCYGLIGWVYRLIIYDNALVTDTRNGNFVFEGQDNLNYKYSLFTNTGSAVIEAGLGYQRNGLKNENAFFVEITFGYGISPLHYDGNGMGSNDITFTMNTLAIKVGIKL